MEIISETACGEFSWNTLLGSSLGADLRNSLGTLSREIFLGFFVDISWTSLLGHVLGKLHWSTLVGNSFILVSWKTSRKSYLESHTNPKDDIPPGKGEMVHKNKWRRILHFISDDMTGTACTHAPFPPNLRSIGWI